MHTLPGHSVHAGRVRGENRLRACGVESPHNTPASTQSLSAGLGQNVASPLAHRAPKKDKSKNTRGGSCGGADRARRRSETQAEAQLAISYAGELASDVLLAPHHGSRSSSSYAFLKRVDPDFVVFSAGYRNSFGHPHDRVVTRYGEFASKTHNTAEAEMISFEFSEGFSDTGVPENKIIHIRE